ncbi:hypothetical protein G4Z16_02060 [Streptomyces bathyalis]|uniref:Uncharacterized protein n=1 Tax=Streptomyces bathyalis TaxID=2710756 RepID=A0A7T1T2U2_9ACTN|nr:hypothetical protein [Streptomyces bathyalis]QPP05371.1 hypothetical protein G4Z16_02060 [Streptomyces bathyalis]
MERRSPGQRAFVLSGGLPGAPPFETLHRKAVLARCRTVGVPALYLADHPDSSPTEVGDALVADASSKKVQDPMAGSPNKLLDSLF